MWISLIRLKYVNQLVSLAVVYLYSKTSSVEHNHSRVSIRTGVNLSCHALDELLYLIPEG